MPHKHNPVAAISARACARRAPGLVATLMGAMEQEYERAAGAWHSEWPTLTALLSTVGSAAAWLTESLVRAAARRRPHGRRRSPPPATPSWPAPSPTRSPRRWARRGPRRRRGRRAGGRGHRSPARRGARRAHRRRRPRCSPAPAPTSVRPASRSTPPWPSTPPPDEEDLLTAVAVSYTAQARPTRRSAAVQLARRHPGDVGRAGAHPGRAVPGRLLRHPRARALAGPARPVHARRPGRRRARAARRAGRRARAHGRAVAGRHDGDAAGRARARAAGPGGAAVHVGAARRHGVRRPRRGGPRGRDGVLRAVGGQPLGDAGVRRRPPRRRRAARGDGRGHARRGLRGLLRGDRRHGPARRPGADHRPDAGDRRRAGPGHAAGDAAGDRGRHRGRRTRHRGTRARTWPPSSRRTR